MAPFEMLVGLVCLLLLMLPLRSNQHRIAKDGNEIVASWERINQYLLSSLKNYILLKVYKKIGKQISLGMKNLDTYLAVNRRHLLSSSFRASIPTIMGTCVVALLSLFSLHFSFTKPVVLLMFFYVFLRIAQGMGEISFVVNSIRLGMPGLRSLYRWHTDFKKYEINNKDILLRGSKTVSKDNLSIVLNDVSFRYSEVSPFVFKHINLSLFKGTTVVIKGFSGSGKSTFLKLVMGLERPTSGSIFIGGVPVDELGEEFWGCVSYVGPDPFLIEGTLRENLIYAHPNSKKITDEEMIQVLKRVCLYDELRVYVGVEDVLSLNMDDFSFLSTGQRQRLAIARSFLRDADIYIWDEATANLDNQTESIILDSIRKSLDDKICLFVTHKDKYDSLGKLITFSNFNIEY